MNKKNILILIIVLLSTLAVLFTHYLIGWGWEKTLVIVSGAGVAMIIFDVLLAKRKFVE